MLRVQAFEALRPAGSRAALVSCSAACAAGAAGSACCDETLTSFRHVLEAATPREARQTVERLLANGSLAPDPEPRMYVYRIARDGARQAGVVACVDRATLDVPLPEAANPTWAAPATALFDDPAGLIASHIAEDMNERPLFHFNAGDGTTHSGWLARSPERYVAAFAQLAGRGRLVRAGACASCDRVLALLLDASTALEPLPNPRCGLFVHSAALATA